MAVACTAVMDNQLENGGTAQKGLTQVFGTPLYMAPEVWEKSYGKSADIWSLGCVMYILITGQYPFWGDAEQDLKWISKKGNYWVPDHLSADSRDLLQKMLCVDATERATAEQVCMCQWLLLHMPGLLSIFLSMTPTAIFFCYAKSLDFFPISQSNLYTRKMFMYARQMYQYLAK